MNDRIFSLMRNFLVIVVALPMGAFAADSFVAQAVSVSGKVLVRGEGTGNVQMTLLKPGDKLFKGTIVNTGSNGAVKLLMTDRTIVDLGPSSLFKVNEYQLNNGGDRKVDLSLDYGQIRTSVNEKISSAKGKFTIRTKAATMGVRGTEFVVNAPIPVRDASGAVIAPPKTSLTVMHGKVEVADLSSPGAAPVAVTPGFQFAKSGDGPAVVSNLGMEGVAQVKADAFQKDMTFAQAVTFDANTSKENNSTTSGQQQSQSSTTADRGGEKKGEDPAGAPPQGGKQTLEGIAMNVETQTKDAPPPPAIGDLHLPGTFTPEVPQSRPIDQLNGRMVNLKVRICPSGVAGC